MNVREILGHLLVHAAAGFAATLSNRASLKGPHAKTGQAARIIGSQIAGAFVSEVVEHNSETAPCVGPSSHPLYSDEQILAERIAVWNHPISLPLETLKTLHQNLQSKE